jgi:hypothetical protein
MRSLLLALVAIALVTFLAAHAILLVLLVRRKPRYRSLIALAVPPLAPYWAWRAGRRSWVLLWGAALGLYALTVAVILR